MSDTLGTMSEERTIGELAREARVPVSTVRHYERTGLLRPSGRTSGNYRVYRSHEVERLFFIRSAQSAGFTLGDIKALLLYRDGLTPPCEEVQGLIEDRLEHIREQMKRLRQVQKVLSAYLDHCREANGDACPVVREIDDASKAR